MNVLLVGCCKNVAYNIDNIKNFVEHSFGVQIFDSAFYFLSHVF